MINPQSDFEDSIFGPSGMHPTPSTLPYPSQPLKTLFGLTTEYLIPEGQKEKVLKKLVLPTKVWVTRLTHSLLATA